MKECSACAERVQTSARVCRYCGYDFKRKRNPKLTQGDLAGCAFNGCLLWIFGPVILLLMLALIGKWLS